MNKDLITICYLYSRSMSIYGDKGNVICLQRRAEWRNKEVKIIEYNIGDKNIDWHDVDIFFFGGGQDLQQEAVADDLQKVGSKIIEQVVKNKAAVLAICGGLQLLAKYYETIDGKKIDGIGLFEAYTVGGKRRFIGNVAIETELFGEKRIIVGFENHSGRTYADWQKVSPLGNVLVGGGNNGEDQTEGIVYLNAVGSYLHGSLLPKNPWLADWLLLRGLERRYEKYVLNDLDDQVELHANQAARELALKSGKVENITS